MDLRTFQSPPVDERAALSLWWYQPFIFADDLVSGVAPTWFIPGVTRSIVKRADAPQYFDRFVELSRRTAKMYQDWFDALCAAPGVAMRGASVFELACNTGYFLLLAKQRGAGACVGIDQADLARQRAILAAATRIHDIDFREGSWSSETHTIRGLRDDETFDVVINTAFAQHISDPLHLFRELARRARRALLLNIQVDPIPGGVLGRLWHRYPPARRRAMRIAYVPEPHHATWGDRFPNDFDTIISTPLVLHSLRACGFKEIRELPASRDWLPARWCRRNVTFVCVK